MVLREWRPFPPYNAAFYLLAAVGVTLIVAVLLLVGQPGFDLSGWLFMWALAAIPGAVGTVAWLLRPKLDMPDGAVPLSALYGVLHGYAWYLVWGSLMHSMIVAVVVG